MGVRNKAEDKLFRKKSINYFIEMKFIQCKHELKGIQCYTLCDPFSSVKNVIMQVRLSS